MWKRNDKGQSPEMISGVILDPLRQQRNPLEIFLVLLSLQAGIMLALGIASPQEEEVGIFIQWVWRAMLIGGSLAVLMGHVRFRFSSLNAQRLQNVGYLGLGFGALAYGVADPTQYVVIAFGVACLIRVWQIKSLICRVHPELCERRPSRWIRHRSHN